ncbi:GtrA family protein [Dermacoccus nishinomiyaensis]|uniref:GtrA family protein n=1 Tax=Dermacoccus nishinomiyaensis TaxID=1274 RepID=UPI0013F48F16|nr:GtrA family protein [Dermacoccus nishinomiyaensis]MCI0153885.1 GtrA family protein [Dermacoccus nishinomiyaensis]NHC31025.1 GtrA family protein [Dermacoccus nishinomiyaensis]
MNPTPGADTAHRSTTAPVSTASTSSGSSDEPMTVNAPGSSRLDALRSPGAAQAMRFAMVGIASTVLYTVLFAVLDTRMNHQIANILALLLCTVLNTWVNQRFTFDAAGHERGRDAHLQSLAILVVTLAVTSGALALEHHQWPHASTLWDTVTVTVGNAIATVIRFVVFRRIFAARD